MTSVPAAPCTSSTPREAEGSTPSAFERAADIRRYRIADGVMATCAAHREAVVLCTTAGKSGRNGRTATIGPTLLWLTCPYLNNLIARLERGGAVARLTEYLRTHPALRAAHVDSHGTYETKARTWLSEQLSQFFLDNFVNISPPDESHGESQCGVADSSHVCGLSGELRESQGVSGTTGAVKRRRPQKSLNCTRKYGNAAVGHPEDLKCLHALAAQSLSSAPNPLGYYVLCYVHHLGVLARMLEVTPTSQGSGSAQPQNDEGTTEALSRVRGELRDYVDDSRNFIRFLDSAEATRSGTRPRGDLSPRLGEPISLQDALPIVNGGCVSYDPMSPLPDTDYCSDAAAVLRALEGKLPSMKRKSRKN